MAARAPVIASPSDPVRARLAELAAATGESWRLLSHLIGRNEAYLHQFMHLGSPRRLPEDERRLLAIHFSVDERQLGARDPWTPAV